MNNELTLIIANLAADLVEDGLPEEAAQRASEYFLLECLCLGGQLAEIRKYAKRIDLSSAFIWSETPEGYDYWASIYWSSIYYMVRDCDRVRNIRSALRYD